MQGEPAGTFKFAIHWPLTSVCVVFLPLLLFLGFWQHDKAQTKDRVQEQWLQQQALPAQSVDISTLDEFKASASFRRIKVSGRFDQERYWLLENQHWQGRVGFQLLMVLTDKKGQHVLVNRGWLPPTVLITGIGLVTPEGELSLSGTLKVPNDSALIDEMDNPLHAWPHRILEIDVSQMATQYDQPLPKQILLLDPDSPAALEIYWQPINLSPGRHFGYAVQWWAMAFALVILWLAANSNIYYILTTKKK